MTERMITLDQNGNPVLDQFSEEGFVDCTFRIAERSSDAIHHRLRLVASHNGIPVGLQVVVRRGIRGGFDANMNLIGEHVYRPAVEFVRSGVESDALITTLAALYSRPAGRLRMVDGIAFTGIALHGDDVDMEKQPIKIKLFGRDSEEEIERGEYFESFFNLDLSSGFVFWNEKDFDYREPLIPGLSTIHPQSPMLCRHRLCIFGSASTGWIFSRAASPVT